MVDVSCEGRATTWRGAWRQASTSMPGVLMALAGVAVFCIGLFVHPATTGVMLLGVGVLMLVLGLVLPVVGEAELGITVLKFKTVKRREAAVRAAVDIRTRRDAERFAFLLAGSADDAHRIVAAALDHALVDWIDGSRSGLSRELHCALVREYLDGVALGVYPSGRGDPPPVPVGTDSSELSPVAARLRTLLPVQRAVLLLHVKRELPVSAIARIVRQPVAAVSDNLAVAERTLDLPVDVGGAAAR